MSTPAAAVEYCREVVRQHDRDHYLASLFTADDVRPRLWGLYAFSHEIARIRELVTEPAAGEIRLAWWTQTIEAIYAGEPIDHPVAQTLADACAAAQLPKQPFLDLIEARRFDLYGEPMATVGDLERYLERASSAVVHLAAKILARANSDHAVSAAGPGGVAYGLVGLLRALPFQRARGQCFVPKDVLARHRLEPGHVLSGARDARMAAALAELRVLAIRRLGAARSLRTQISPAAVPAFLPLALVEAYAAKLARRGFDALTTVADISAAARLFRLWRAARAGRF